MKKLLLSFVFIANFVFSQETDTTLDRIVEAEMKAASAQQSFQVNPNTLNYDVTYHELRFTVDPAQYFISGVVTTAFTALANMTTVTFDLADELTVSSVTMNGNSLSFTQLATEELVITLPTTLATGSSASVVITYSGAPANNGFGSFETTTHSGTPVLWTLSEPFGARDWWPCKQDLNDKISNIDVYITAPSQYVSVSNGLEISQNTVGANKTTHFHHSYPIPAYLIAIAVTNYQIFTQTAGTAPNTFPIVNYIYPENFSSAQTSLAVTLPIMNLFENLFETYPFHQEKYGHAQFSWGGGMEHTTVSFMGGWSQGLIAHELAHQWFGDKITCGTWKDIWLNEGFAEYLAGLVVENLNGATDFVNWKQGKVSNITSQTAGAVYLTDAEAQNVNRIFSSRLTYNKGSMVVHMLRWKMGDTAFYNGVRSYLADSNLAFAYAITTDLQPHLENAYGSSLQEFFNDWLYNQGYPSYNITVTNWGAGQAKITINQTQSHSSVSFFEMPLEIRLHGALGATHDVVVNNTVNNQEFIVPVPFTVTNVTFDPNVHIISKNNTASLSNQDFMLDQTIMLYPNPVNNVLNIKTPTSIQILEINMFNSLGQNVANFTNNTINTSMLNSGVYYLQIATNEGTFHKNFIKN